MESILDILRKEDELVEKHKNLCTEYTELLRKIDDCERYPDYYCATNAEISAMKERVFIVENERDVLHDNIRATREKIRRKLIRLFG